MSNCWPCWARFSDKKVVLVFYAGAGIAIPFALYIRFVRKIEVIPFGLFWR